MPTTGQAGDAPWRSPGGTQLGGRGRAGRGHPETLGQKEGCAAVWKGTRWPPSQGARNSRRSWVGGRDWKQREATVHSWAGETAIAAGLAGPEDKRQVAWWEGVSQGQGVPGGCSGRARPGRPWVSGEVGEGQALRPAPLEDRQEAPRVLGTLPSGATAVTPSVQGSTRAGRREGAISSYRGRPPGHITGPRTWHRRPRDQTATQRKTEKGDGTVWLVLPIQ